MIKVAPVRRSVQTEVTTDIVSLLDCLLTAQGDPLYPYPSSVSLREERGGVERLLYEIPGTHLVGAKPFDPYKGSARK